MPRIEIKDAISRTYDYVIIGGGTAGLVLAARLTETADLSVLVLEAGEENLNDPVLMKLGQFAMIFGQKQYEWCAKTVPQPHAANTVIPWPRGRLLGGSSAVNFTVWNKPAREDFDAWEKLGNEGWNWDRFNKYIERAITYTPPDLSAAEHARRGTPEVLKALWAKGKEGNGPVKVSHPPVPVAPAPLNGNPNGIVLGAMAVDPETRERSFAGNAYWKPSSERPNLHLLTGVIAHRLVTKEVDGELLATGVEFSHKDSSGNVCIAKASREVILSAGDIMTPQILELSGIGRPDVLQSVGIPVKLALDGVGENVQDHVNSTIVVELNENAPDLTFDVLRHPGEAEKHLALFAQGEGLHNMGIHTYIYAPISTFSDRAPEIIANTQKEIERGIAAGKYNPGVIDQYRIVLENMKNVPNCEIIAYPTLITMAPAYLTDDTREGPTPDSLLSRAALRAYRSHFVNKYANANLFDSVELTDTRMDQYE
ncbi:hypothetical protein NP233_g11711 [Leucocoprinus birnbaumii]|uniref:Glucose-methanol-choline oxidoreductase N-terminal domain-containing protein n=1 Tax=Leucocoprinus birnbaumii TaxID=56174 RepID=A0AAD5YQP0_9AGAR|nr:hypothetical protein NP233_g11711 [Leucocoprinus birnbaumii]